MTRFNVNTSYFMHSTPEYNRKHQEENSKYNHEYYEKHKEKWQDNDEDSSKSGSSKDDEKDSKDKKSGSDSKKSKEDKIKSILGKLNGGSKKGGSATGKSSSKKSGSSEKSSKKSKETDEEKKKREEEEKAEKERLAEEERKKNSEAAENARKMLEANAKYIEEHQQGKKKAKPKTIKHAAVYVGINSQPYFEHHGRLGMKWGKRNGPPYPLDYSKLSEEERAKDKQRVREEGDIESVGYKKNRSYFTDQEINEVINRYQLNQRINQLSADSAKMKAGKSKTEQLADNMAKVADVGNKLSNALNAGTNVYNNVAKIMNAFGDSDLPIIGQQKQKESPFNKMGKKELDKAINDIEKNMGKYSTKELQELNQRKNTLNLLTKERDEKRAAEAKAAEEKAKGEQGLKDELERRDREFNESVERAKGVYRQVFKSMNNDIVEHVTGEVVDAGQQWFNDYLALEDKQRR